MIQKRTDLALEARELWHESAGATTRLSGVKARKHREEGLAYTTVDILDETGAKALGKPVGRYLTIDLPPSRFPQSVRVTGRQLRTLLPQQGSILVVGLGNRSLTPDAVGPLAVQHLLVTRHLKDALPQHFGAFRSVAAVCPGVLGQTGMEAAEAVTALVGALSPAAVIVIDALASRRMERLCATLQLSNSGLVPGSGVGNHRFPLNQETLGVPVIAIGVPTVVDAATVAADLLEENGIRDISPAQLQQGRSLFLTTRDIDAAVAEVGKLVGYAINWALQDLEIEDIAALLG